MKEIAKPVREVTVNRENLGVEEGMTATSMSLEPWENKTPWETGTQITVISDRTTSLKRTQGTK